MYSEYEMECCRIAQRESEEKLEEANEKIKELERRLNESLELIKSFRKEYRAEIDYRINTSSKTRDMW